MTFFPVACPCTRPMDHANMSAAATPITSSDRCIPSSFVNCSSGFKTKADALYIPEPGCQNSLLCYHARMPCAFLIDTDVASDDAVAIIMALRAPDVRVVAITTVAGNVDVQQATRNALYTVELCGADVPVYTGAEKPLLRAYQNATWFHGCDGLGELGYPPPKRSPAKLHAVDATIEAVEANPGLVIVALAPLTNIALAVTRKPDIVSRVGRCVVMGGAPCCEGNVTPAAEYNIWVDPEA